MVINWHDGSELPKLNSLCIVKVLKRTQITYYIGKINSQGIWVYNSGRNRIPYKIFKWAYINE